jgi:hypothetical protein
MNEKFIPNKEHVYTRNMMITYNISLLLQQIFSNGEKQPGLCVGEYTYAILANINSQCLDDVLQLPLRLQFDTLDKRENIVETLCKIYYAVHNYRRDPAVGDQLFIDEILKCCLSIPGCKIKNVGS